MIRRNKQRGTAMVEFALILPVFLLLAVGGLLMLMALSTYGNVGYIAQQVAQCRANYLLGGASSLSSQCPGSGAAAATTYANTLATAMNMAPNINVTAETTLASCPGAGCIQDQLSYPYTPFVPLIPAFTMNTSAAAAVTMYSQQINVTGATIPANTCLLEGTVAIPGAQPWMVATANPTTAESPSIFWNAYVDPSIPNQVDLNLCNLSPTSPVTPLAPSYNVRVIPG